MRIFKDILDDHKQRLIFHTSKSMGYTEFDESQTNAIDETFDLMYAELCCCLQMQLDQIMEEMED